MAISVGDAAPAGSLTLITADGPAAKDASELFGSGTVALVGVPGAFTPTCNDNHVPGYLENAEALKARGVDAIYILSANDHHVMRAWEKNLGSAGKVHMLADWDASYAKALGLEIDISAYGLGMRAKRFSILFKDGKAAAVNVEDNPGQVSNTSAAALMDAL
ncbi:MAG: peroxiredoxin [Rhizobiaceae bacterium]|jgi:peroxiredoxin|nr:peroxiredoxin [Rhizobiaceae bacterium]